MKTVSTFNEYQKAAAETATYRKGLPMKELLGPIYPALGLNGEAGEVANETAERFLNTCIESFLFLKLNAKAGGVAEHVKKMIRNDNGVLTVERKEKLLLEMGDVLWYLAALATELDENLSTVADLNIHKLGKRYETSGLTPGGICREK